MIFVTHGVLRAKDPRRISHALLEDEQAFTSHLQNRPQPYVSLEHALHGQGDALTIDDATFDGLHAATIALRLGHQVSWCINGSHVLEQLPYFPFQISSMLDNTPRPDCLFAGTLWDLSNSASKRLFRSHLKSLYMRYSDVRDARSLVQELSLRLDCDSVLEPALQTVSVEDIQSLWNCGCDLQNHGWSHLNPNCLSPEGVMEDICKNRSWLGSTWHVHSPIYVPPYGYPVPALKQETFPMLLADRAVTPTQGTKISNRSYLRCDSAHQGTMYANSTSAVYA